MALVVVLVVLVVIHVFFLSLFCLDLICSFFGDANVFRVSSYNRLGV